MNIFKKRIEIISIIHMICSTHESILQNHLMRCWVKTKIINSDDLKHIYNGFNSKTCGILEILSI